MQKSRMVWKVESVESAGEWEKQPAEGAGPADKALAKTKDPTMADNGNLSGFRGFAGGSVVVCLGFHR